MRHLSFQAVGTLTLRMLLLCLEVIIRWWSHLLRCLRWRKPRWGYITTTWTMWGVKLLWVPLWNEHTLECLRRLVYYGFVLLLISLQLYILLLQWRSTTLRNVIKRVLLLKWRSISLRDVVKRLLMRIVRVLKVLLVTVGVELRILLDHDWLDYGCWHLDLLLIYVIGLLLIWLR